MAEKWTKTSWPPSSGLMNPKPLSALNHLTVPCATRISPCLQSKPRTARGPAVNPRARHEAHTQKLQPAVYRHLRARPFSFGETTSTRVVTDFREGCPERLRGSDVSPEGRR